MSDAGNFLVELIRQKLKGLEGLGLVERSEVHKLQNIVTLVCAEILFSAWGEDDEDDDGGADPEPTPPSPPGNRYLFSGNGDTWTFSKP